MGRKAKVAVPASEVSEDSAKAVPPPKRGPKKRADAPSELAPAPAPKENKKPTIKKLPPNNQTLTHFLKQKPLGQDASIKTLVKEPPDIIKLTKIVETTNEAEVHSIDIKRLIESWQSDDDDFELFDLQRPLPSETERVSQNMIDETAHIVNKIGSILIDMSKQAQEEERANAPTPHHNKSNSGMGSIINDTIEISPSTSKTLKTKPINMQVHLDNLFADDDADDDDLCLATVAKNFEQEKLASNLPQTSPIEVIEVKSGKTRPHDDRDIFVLDSIPAATARKSIPKSLIEIENKENLESNSTSTPIRSILKHSDVASVIKGNVKARLIVEASGGKIADASCVGLTQALQLINQSRVDSPSASAKSYPGRDKQTQDRRLKLFDMNAKLNDLFSLDELDDAKGNNDDLDDVDWDDIRKLESSLVQAITVNTSSGWDGRHAGHAVKDESSVVFEKSVREPANTKRNKLFVEPLSDEESRGDEAKAHESNDDEFLKIIGEDNSNSSPSRDNIDDSTSSEEPIHRPQKKKTTSKFILDEAEASDQDEGSSAEEDGEYDPSFVDNRNDISCSDSMMAVYQKSIKNAVPYKSYMNRPMRPITDDIFSQMPTQDDASYLLDSFVVADDHVSFAKKEKKKSKKTGSKIIERQERDKPKRIERFQHNAALLDSGISSARAQPGTSAAAASQDPDDIISMRRPRNRKLLLDSYFEEEPADNDIVVLDDHDDQNSYSKKSKPKSTRLCERLSRLSPIEDENDDECELLDMREDRKNEVKVVDDQDDDDDDYDINMWLVNETFSRYEKSTTPAKVEKPSNWIFVNPVLEQSAPEIFENLRENWCESRIVVHSAVETDILVSQKCACLCLRWTEIDSALCRQQFLDRFCRARVLYSSLVTLIQDDRGSTKCLRSKSFDMFLANLSRASRLMYSKPGTDQMSRQLEQLSKTELSDGGDGLDLDFSCILKEAASKFEFFLSLPNVSFFNALYLTQGFETLAQFCNSSLERIKTTGRLSELAARRIIKLL